MNFTERCLGHDQIPQNRKSLRVLFVVILFTALLCSTATIQAQQGQYITPGGTRYFLYTPPGYDPATTSYPVLLCLLGGAEIGDNLSIILGASAPRSPAWLIDRGLWPAGRPFIVVTPQLKRDPSINNVNDQEWPMAKVDSVLEYVRSTHNVDANRIYMMGISLGGAACWNYAATYPEKIAAIVPMSGKTNLAQACSLTDIPVWAFHGEIDGLVTPQFSVDMVNAINACSPGDYNPHLNLLHARGHEGWNEIFTETNGYDVYTWLEQFSKNNLANKPPYVFAGGDKKVLLRSAPIHITGEYFDIDGTISNVAWTQTSGAALTLENTNTRTLKISNLIAGVFEFQLQVTDNSGVQRSDRVVLEVLGSAPAGTLQVTNLVLVNGSTNQDIGNLVEGQEVNLTTLGEDEINIRATATGGTVRSVRFSVNSDQNTRTMNSNEPFLIVKQRTTPEWTIPNGSYTVCATPYPSNAAAGTPGISQCFTITVTSGTTTVQNFYSKPGTDISVLTSWGGNADGSGAAPTSFSADNQVFNIQNQVSCDNLLTISGTGSGIWVKSGGVLTLNNRIAAPLNAGENSVIRVHTSQTLTLGTLDPGSSVHFGSAATTIPAGTYGSIAFEGTGSVKTLPSGTLSVAGDVTIDDNVTVNSTPDNTSILSVAGNVTINDDTSFQPSATFSLHLVSGAEQLLNVRPASVVFHEVVISPGTQATLTALNSPTLLELGSASGGGLVIQNGARFSLGANDLSLTGRATLNGLDQNGELGMSGGDLSITSDATGNSYLYPLKGQDSVSTATVNLTGSGELLIQDTLFITDFIKNLNGVVQANGYLSLVSTTGQTARIAPREGTGSIEGEVQVQRLIGPGKIYRYLGFPVTGATVSDLQQYVPVTGPFAGASTDPQLSNEPSLYYYDESTSGWIAYPPTSNLQELTQGRGYTLYMREAAQDTRLILKGTVQQGDFSFTLTPDPNAAEPADGANLVANPFASPIQWGAEGWISSGVSTTIAIRDNNYPGGGRFLVWDGDTGDEEFGGHIAQGQAFWVRTINASPVLTVQEGAMTDGQPDLFRKKSGTPFPSLAVELHHKGLVDKTYLKYRAEGKDEFDPLWDAVKQKNGYFNLSTRSADDVALAINNLPVRRCSVVPLQVETTSIGDYTLAFRGSMMEETDRQVYLEDHYLDSVVMLPAGEQTGGEYTFRITDDPLSKENSRFSLRIQKIALPVITQEGSTLLSGSKTGNQWIFNGDEIEGATGPFYEAAQSGNYQVRVTEGVCSRLSDPIVFQVTETSPPSSGSEVRVYPNPVPAELFLDGMDTDPTTAYYTIVNTAGIKVKSGELAASTSQERTSIDTKELPPGLYILFLDKGRSHYRIRFVKE